MTIDQTAASPAEEDYDDGFDLEGDQPEGVAPPQVSSMIAIIRIVSVLGMGLCISFGLFIMLIGVRGVIVGVPIVLLSIPLFFGMQFAEKLAHRSDVDES